MASFDELVALGPAEASRRLRKEKGWEALERFGESLLRHSCPMGMGQAASSNLPVDVNGSPLSTWVMWLATSPDGEEQPEAYMKRVLVRRGCTGAAAPRFPMHVSPFSCAGPEPFPMHWHSSCPAHLALCAGCTRCQVECVRENLGQGLRGIPLPDVWDEPVLCDLP